MKLAVRIYLAACVALLALAYCTQGTLEPSDFTTSAVLSAFLFPPVFLPFALWRLVFRAKSAPKDGLDRVLHTWPSGDDFTLRQLMQSCVCLGQVGSGKSSGFGRFIVRIMLRIPRSGCLFLCSKPEDLPWLLELAREAGRIDDMVVFSAESKEKSNLFEYQVKNGADARMLVNSLMVGGEVLDTGGGGKANDPFWPNSMNRYLWFAIAALIVAIGTVTVRDISRFLDGAAKTPEEFKSDAFQKGFHNGILEACFDKHKNEVEQADFDIFYPFWINEFSFMDSKVRTSVIAGINNILLVYNQGLVSRIISGGTTTSIDGLFEGKWLIWNFPIPVYGNTGKFLMSYVKLIAQQAILRRAVKPGDNVVGVYADESPTIMNSYDIEFMNESRSHLAFTTYLAQSIHSFHNALGGEHKTFGMMTAFGHIVSHTVGDSKTAEFLSELLGKTREIFITPSLPGTSADTWGDLTGNRSLACSVSETYQPVLQPAAFMTGLRNGGASNDFVVDAYLIRFGAPFQGSNQRYQLVSFSQK